MTLEFRKKPSGRTFVVTTACGLCGHPLRERQGISDHLPNCPVCEIYAERGALRDGGPNPERVQGAIRADESDEIEPRLATDGGPEVEE